MKAPRRKQDDETLDLFEWGQGRPANDTARSVSTFERTARGWVEQLADGRLIAWNQTDDADTMEPTSIETLGR